MRNEFTNLDAVAQMALEASPFVPRALFMKMLRTPGGIAPVTAESRKAARAAKAVRLAAKVADVAAQPAPKVRSDAQKRFLAGYHARARAAARVAA